MPLPRCPSCQVQKGRNHLHGCTVNGAGQLSFDLKLGQLSFDLGVPAGCPHARETCPECARLCHQKRSEK